MGVSYFASARERKAALAEARLQRDKEAARVDDERRKIAAQIVMTLVDKIIADIVRPGPSPEERECYEMAGEVRALTPELEEIAKRIIDVNDGVE